MTLNREIAGERQASGETAQMPQAGLVRDEHERGRVRRPVAQPAEAVRQGGPLDAPAQAQDRQRPAVGQRQPRVGRGRAVPAQPERERDLGQRRRQPVDRGDRVQPAEQLRAATARRWDGRRAPNPD